ncbi:hypothetical protein PFISCL1PPCAC_9803, partial [Pristionchus fissidentatus]
FMRPFGSSSSINWSFLLLLIALSAQLSEAKRGGGRSSSRGASRSRSSSSSKFSSSRGSSRSSSTKSWFGSGSSGKSFSSWWKSKSSKNSDSGRSGGGYKYNGGSPAWGSSASRPSVSRYSVSSGIFRPSSTIYYGSSSCFGCSNSYSVYHYYPRSHYYAMRHQSTTSVPNGPNADQVSSTLLSNDTAIYSNETVIYSNLTETGNVTQVMEIAEPSRPIIIQDIAFFWDTAYLPNKNSSGCVSVSPANANSTISYCDVKDYSRCQRDIKELPEYSPESIFFPDGRSPSHLAWLCPTGTACCEWECCHEKTAWQTFWTFSWVLIVIFILLYCFAVRFTRCCGRWKEDRRDNDQFLRLMKS